MEEVLFETRGLSYSYNSRQERPSLNDVNVKVRKGVKIRRSNSAWIRERIRGGSRSPKMTAISASIKPVVEDIRSMFTLLA